MKWFVYILRCVDNSLYTGSTPNVERRFREHSEGRGGRYTSLHKPKSIAYVEDFEDQKQALKREKQLKGWSREKKEALMRGDEKALKWFAKRVGVRRKAETRKRKLIV